VSGKAWFQFLAVMDCSACGPAKGRPWVKKDDDRKAVHLAVDPCLKHRRMLDRQGWVR
jgi:hypothetical protein